MSVRLRPLPTANGMNGTVGICNVGSETTTYESVQVRADIPLFISAGNNLSAPGSPAYAVASPSIGAIAANTSTTVVAVRGTSALHALGGPAVRLGGASEIDLGDTVLGSVWHEEPGMAGPYPYAIEALSQTHALHFAGAVYGFPRVLRVRSAMAGLFLECYAAHDPAQTRIYLEAGATLEGGRIDVVPMPGTSGGTLIEGQQNYASAVHGVEINLYQQGIDLKANGTLSGCVIRSSRSLAATKAGITAGTRTGNVILATDGVHVDGVTPW